MTDDDAARAIRSYRYLIRVSRRPWTEPSYSLVMDDLRAALAWYRGMDDLTDLPLRRARLIATILGETK